MELLNEEVDLTRNPEERFQDMQRTYINSLTPEEREQEVKKFKIFLKEIYNKIISILKEYVDLREEYYVLAANWIIGSYLHSSFNTYPYLFLNAMRGSGKSRMLNLIASLAYKGKVIGSPTEAVLFRTPSGETLCLDEYEGIMRKGNEGLREILNASYKKGMTIRRMKQKKVNGTTEQVVEEFEPYRPICIANIWGMEEVLGDRCITLILEKSSRKDIMRLIEDFSTNPYIEWVKKGLETSLVQLCSFFSVVKGIEKWNLWVKMKYTTLYTLNTLTTHNTLTTQETEKNKENLTTEELQFFEKIDSTGISGRNLELFFPLLTIGHFISEDNFECILKVASQLTKEKREEEMTESLDVSVYDFVSKKTNPFNFISIRVLLNEFKDFVGNENHNKDNWLNERWFGRALKRLNLILDKRRVSGGIQVILDINKAKLKMQEFNYGLKDNNIPNIPNIPKNEIQSLRENQISENGINGIFGIKSQILDKIKDLDSKDEFFKITDEVKSKFNLTETEIRDILTELLSEGLIYEPRKDIWRYLG